MEFGKWVSLTNAVLYLLQWVAGAGTGASSSSPHLTKADSLALQLGLSHVVLGVNMPAVAVPHSPAVSQAASRAPEYCTIFEVSCQLRSEHT
jgi:hypothetical protein